MSLVFITTEYKTIATHRYLTVLRLLLRAADAVLTGHTENIISFHMKNISNNKEKAHLLLVTSPHARTHARTHTLKCI